jgi:F0F1-type ATP synthase assembly protein I
VTDPPPEGPPRKPLPELPGAVAFLTMGTTAGGCVAVGAYLGVLIDDGWRIAPWGILIGLILGVVAGVASVVKIIQRWL